ncbi:hypothetical protein V5O48_014389 [Marasmius crinis-equi]|uniref:WD40 repeat-like protein n=1 Tax=Marasmius crinis-equi TaxID=585013 RepID=A0ABR3EXH3_9AGAR
MSSLNIDDDIVKLPIVTIQPAFTTVIHEVWSGLIPSDEIWVSRYHHGKDSIHDRIRVLLDEEDRDKVVWEATSLGQDGIRLTLEDEGYMVDSTTRLLVPIQTYLLEEGSSSSTQPRRITSLAISSDQSQFAVGLLDGSAFLYPVVSTTSSSDREKYAVSQNVDDQKRKQMLVETQGKKTAHKSTVTALRFFPSSRVLLSAGADFTMRIWAAEPASPPPPTTTHTTTQMQIQTQIPARTLTAHTRPITSIAINPLDRGRTVLSGSADGSVRLWNVSTGNEVMERRVRQGGSPVVGVVLDVDVDSEQKKKPRLYAAIQDGSFEVFEVQLPVPTPDQEEKPSYAERIFKSTRSVGGALTSIAVSASDSKSKFVATGSANGIVSIYLNNEEEEDYRHLTSFKRNGASIEGLSFLPQQSSSYSLLAVATSDGLPWIASISPSTSEGASVSVSVYAELTGGEIDAVRDVVAIAGEVWTVCDDGVVRRYHI